VNGTEFEIRRLTPDMADEYVRFFDETPHYHGVKEQKCYCVCWSSADCTGRDFSTWEKRRAIAAEYVRDGSIQGYVACADGKTIGWCSANAREDCLKCLSWSMFMGDVPVEGDTARVKSVFCFTVAPEWQRRGVASALLAQVCRDAAEEGFDCVEAYPHSAFENTAEEFMGPAEMYFRQGFESAGRVKDRMILRKILK